MGESPQPAYDLVPFLNPHTEVCILRAEAPLKNVQKHQHTNAMTQLEQRREETRKK